MLGISHFRLSSHISDSWHDGRSVDVFDVGMVLFGPMFPKGEEEIMDLNQTSLQEITDKIMRNQKKLHHVQLNWRWFLMITKIPWGWSSSIAPVDVLEIWFPPSNYKKSADPPATLVNMQFLALRQTHQLNHKKNRGPLLSMKYCLFNRGPYNGLL